jgi:hypothetical protein
MPLQTEFEFLLPRGYVDEEGNLHRQGVMRLATAGDEILPMKDHRVQANPAYLTVILLSRHHQPGRAALGVKVVEDSFRQTSPTWFLPAAERERPRRDQGQLPAAALLRGGGRPA